jgi:hypothetical protein
LNGWLIFSGILVIVITLAAIIITIYLLFIITTTTSTTSNYNINDIFFFNEFLGTTTTTTTTRPLIQITQPDDSIFGIYNTTAGQSTGGLNGRFSVLAEEPPMAIDGLLTTKYLNFGNNGSGSANLSQAGINTGFYVTPNISNASVVCGLLFGTAMDNPLRDPIAVTLEGTNSTALNSSSTWTLIYSGPTGIDPVNTPNRSTYGTLQVFSNTIAYQSYRLLITAQRSGYSNAVQYSEAQLMGYY